MSDQERPKEAEGRGTNVGAVEPAERAVNEEGTSNYRSDGEKPQRRGYEDSRNSDEFEELDGAEKVAKGYGAQYESGEGNSGNSASMTGSAPEDPSEEND